MTCWRCAISRGFILWLYQKKKDNREHNGFIYGADTIGNKFKVITSHNIVPKTHRNYGRPCIGTCWYLLGRICSRFIKKNQFICQPTEETHNKYRRGVNMIRQQAFLFSFERAKDENKKKKNTWGKFTFRSSSVRSTLLSLIALFTVCSFPVDQIHCLMYFSNLTQ